ncbi:MAG: tRNA pseudouridine(55) synthase TruB [Chitinophagales bacterium]|nr:tRNA pseudouridine(55) synthase TruB [Chitinophagales bacterium]
MFTLLTPETGLPAAFPKSAVLLINKPLGWTSFDVVNKIRWLLCKRLGTKKLKVGHAGTLDPLADGLLLLCVGEATRLIDQFQAMPKVYTGVFTFGATTASYDREKACDNFFPVEHLSDELLQSLLPKFRGAVVQIPPVYSAVKVDGKRVYKNARTGETVEMPERTVQIDTFTLGNLQPVPPPEFPGARIISNKGAAIWQHPDYEAGKQCTFEVKCSKGTYIRSLAFDLGEAAGSGTYLSALRRTASGGFELKDAWTIEQITAAANTPANP